MDTMYPLLPVRCQPSREPKDDTLHNIHVLRVYSQHGIHCAVQEIKKTSGQVEDMKKTAETAATFLIILAAGGMLGYFLHHLFSQRQMYLNALKEPFSKWTALLENSSFHKPK